MSAAPAREGQPFTPKGIVKPDPALLNYYLITALFTGPLFPLVFLAGWFRYKSLEYEFSDEGVSMRVGVLFKKEVHLTFRRIQDINVTRGLVQRKLGLASVALQTASGNATAEMTIEGTRDPDALRDYLYSRMRGAQGAVGAAEKADDEAPADEALALLTEIRDLLRKATRGVADHA